MRAKLDGKPLEVPVAVEEKLVQWADVAETDFAKPAKIRENAWRCLQPLLVGAGYKAQSLDDIDVEPIRIYKESKKQKEAEERKAKPVEVRKREQEDKERANAYFQTCIIDGELQKVTNSTTEPPGIFRGRGEHPNAGMSKERIMPEFVSLNVGEDAVIPKCPVVGHAWKEVVHNPKATWLTTFRDEASEWNNNVKYLNLAAESKLKGLTDKQKYERARRLKAIIGEVRSGYTDDMESASLEINQLGVATWLIDRLALRVGNEKGEDEADTVGCCSLRVEHVGLDEGENKVKFDFLGKDSMRYLKVVDTPPLVYKLMNKFMFRAEKMAEKLPKDPKDDLFCQINAGRLNDHLKTHMPDLSAKVFRTYNASVKLQELLNQKEEKSFAEKLSPDEKKAFYDKCNREVAILCNHKKAEAKNLPEQLSRLETKIKEKQKELVKLNSELKKAKMA